MFQITGTIDYGTKYCVAWVDDNLAKYYRSLIPKYYYVQPGKYKTHCTIISKYDKPTCCWGKYQGQSIILNYEPILILEFPYWGLNVYSDDIRNIRLEAGLTEFMGNHNCYHITIGNVKR